MAKNKQSTEKSIKSEKSNKEKDKDVKQENVKQIDTESEKNKTEKVFVKRFAKTGSSARKKPQPGKSKDLRDDFEGEIKKLKVQLNTSLQENSDLLADLEQVRQESRNLRSKLTGLGVDISSLQKDDETDLSPDDDETRENIRLLEWRLSSIATSLKFDQARVQLFLHFKGGTGKTTLAASSGYKLAELGYRVLMIDTDPLGQLTEFFRITNLEVKDSLYDVLINGKEMSKAVVKTRVNNLDIIPSNLSLSAIEVPLAGLPLPGERLRRALTSLKTNYDFILIDCAPNIGFLSLNAILSANDIFVPVQPDYLSYYGLKTLFEIIASIENDFLFSFDNVCIVLNRFNEFQKVCFSAMRALETNYNEYLLKSIIRESADITNAVSSGKTVFELNKISRGSEDILKFIFEVLFYVGGKKW